MFRSSLFFQECIHIIYISLNYAWFVFFPIKILESRCDKATATNNFNKNTVVCSKRPRRSDSPTQVDDNPLYVCNFKIKIIMYFRRKCGLEIFVIRYHWYITCSKLYNLTRIILKVQNSTTLIFQVNFDCVSFCKCQSF